MRAFVLQLSYLAFCFGAFSGVAQLIDRQAVVVASTQEISRLILGGDSPIELPAGEGWRSFSFSSPGTAISPLLEGLGPEGEDRRDIAQTLQNLQLYDKPMRLINGFAWARESRLYDVWAGIVVRGQPILPAIDDLLLKDMTFSAALRTIYHTPDKVDVARGVKYLSEPSEKYRKYLTFREADQLLRISESSRKDLWRFHPITSSCVSLEDARSKLDKEWRTYGYKRQVEEAFAVVDDRTGSMVWSRWQNISDRVAWGTESVGDRTVVPRTYLFPAPRHWNQMSTWVRLRCRAGMGSGDISFEVARVSVVRPWFDIQELLSGTILLASGGELVSDGMRPSPTSLPDGIIGAYVEELVLIRGIRVNGTFSLDNHPIGSIASPDTLNILGFVVRSLPRLPR